jgi:A/G-specific adenine glycosylase
VLLDTRLFARRLLAWYDRSQRRLPWRVDDRTGAAADPYHVLVSEAMLQQTQVATVIPYFSRFIQRFPTLRDLAAADEQDVLRAWQGLGYYSRARNLRAAAKTVLDHHGGQLPRDPDNLLKLPGIGRYTAGAIASIAFGRRAPILDGNVTRVLCRIDRIQSDPRDRTTLQLLWRRAEEILPTRRVGAFNTALMELGATVCIPRSPQCLICPVREHCEAYAAGVQQTIPPPRQAAPTPLLRRAIFCIRRNDHWLIEQRPPTGRWAGMWQFVTVPADESATPQALLPLLPVRTTGLRPLGTVTHGLTHRRYHFDVYACESPRRQRPPAPPPPREWVKLERLSDYPLPRPHLKVVDLLRPARHEGTEARRHEELREG